MLYRLEAMVLTLNSTSSHRFNQATKSLSDSKDFNETITAEHLRQLRAPRPDLVGSSLLHMLFDVGARHAQQAGSLIRQLFAKSKDLTANPLTRPDKNGKTSLEVRRRKRGLEVLFNPTPARGSWETASRGMLARDLACLCHRNAARTRS